MTEKKSKPKARKKPVKKTKHKIKELIPIPKGVQCTARVKTCTKKSCRHKFPPGDKSWVCPDCETYRRCKSKAKQPYTVCRMHGAGGGRPPLTGKFIPPAQIADAYNALINDPSLLSLAFNIAMSEARTRELLEMIDSMDIRAQAGDISMTLNELLQAVFRASDTLKNAGVPDADTEYMIFTAKAVIEALKPAVQTEKVWRQVNNQLEITRRLNDTERKWIDQHDQMVPMSQILEALSVVIRMALKFIENASDRKAFSEQMRSLMPGIN